jgi:hypothetical protein
MGVVEVAGGPVAKPNVDRSGDCKERMSVGH